MTFTTDMPKRQHYTRHLTMDRNKGSNMESEVHPCRDVLDLDLSTALPSVWPSDGVVIDVVRIGRLIVPVNKFDILRIMFLDHDIHISHVSMDKSFLMERTYSNIDLGFCFNSRFAILEVPE